MPCVNCVTLAVCKAYVASCKRPIEILEMKQILYDGIISKCSLIDEYTTVYFKGRGLFSDDRTKEVITYLLYKENK